MWLIRISDSARKNTKNFPKSDQKRILDALDVLSRDPFVLDITKLKDRQHNWRVRVGNYRIFLELFQKEKAVFVYNIKRRTTATY